MFNDLAISDNDGEHESGIPDRSNKPKNQEI